MRCLQECKRYTDEIYRRSIKGIPKAVINHIKHNGYDSAAVFTAYEAGNEFKEVGLQGNHYFITFVSTYGNEFDENSYNTKHKTVYEVGKVEGNDLYKQIKTTMFFDDTESNMSTEERNDYIQDTDIILKHIKTGKSINVHVCWTDSKNYTLCGFVSDNNGNILMKNFDLNKFKILSY